MRNLDSIVNQILSESFETGESNATNAGGHPAQRGGVERQMLSGELVSSPAYFFQPPSADTHQKLNALLDGQSKSGLGELVGFGEAVNNFVEAYLEDTAVDMYTNSNNVEYLINSLKESGYEEYASAIDAITLNPTIDDVSKINKMVETLGKNNKNQYFVESLIYIAEQIVEADEEGTNEAPASATGEGQGASADKQGDTSEGEPADTSGKEANGSASAKSNVE